MGGFLQRYAVFWSGARLVAAAALGVALTSAPCAQAAIRVTGDARALRVEADGASIADLLAALKDSIGLSYRSSVSLDLPISGRFAGSVDELIQSVLSPLDYSYVYSSSAKKGRTLVILSGGAEGIDMRVASLGAAQRVPAPRQQASSGGAQFCAEVSDSTQALMQDATLREGDVVVTDEGVRVFEGSKACPHAISDFRTLAEARDLGRGTRRVLAEVERAIRPNHGDRPIVATDPTNFRGR
ncbi:hypothetical protein [Methylocystis bryophila]|uniref:Secretin/TonB short N-terminal domain-containing protein n=1 Tax=Methylocystis bryophila TaxID=655015 RepID=A0A1W6MS76_9HYPH|nr:hypothetical protein [Methylocystis bryophila]ARN80415.1 hypothetical protein B1812_04225 [Methylocystis bryophila]BDV40419.1 hypothetical protein DSM21852_36720 [Methylocystis bryophila]